MSLLEVSGLSHAFGGVQALNAVSFQLGKGEVLALIGPNGAGKTTCFNALTGYLRPDRGAIRFNGRELVGMKPRRIWRLGVGRTFQITETFTSMTVAENVQMALLSHHRETFQLFSRATTRNRAAADRLLARVGLAAAGDQPTATLAYGDRKRLELAIALAHGPRLLLMDEPTAGVAPDARSALMALVTAIVAEEGVSVLFTEHNMDVVFGCAHRILVLHRGALIAEGDPAAIRADPAVRAAYLGGEAIMPAPSRSEAVV